MDSRLLNRRRIFEVLLSLPSVLSYRPQIPTSVVLVSKTRWVSAICPFYRGISGGIHRAPADKAVERERMAAATAEDKYNRKNPAVKRILQEVKEMQSNPSDDFMSLPLEVTSPHQTLTLIHP